MKDLEGREMPKSIPKKKAGKIMYWDDERRIGNNIIVTLNFGHCFEDQAHHVEGADTVKGFIDFAGWSLQECHCKDCTNNISIKPI